jgi:serine/threonine-protein kinase
MVTYGRKGTANQELPAVVSLHGHGIAGPDGDWVLDERYRICAVIGRGGMGVVYRAWDRVGERYTVIKMPRSDLPVDTSVRERFRRELEMASSLNHPAIVPVLAVGEFKARNGTNSDGSGVPFAVMPYLAGGSLQRRQNRRRRETFPQAGSLWEWLPEVASALDYVHARGLLHRDVKPANVLFDGLGRPYLGDFGVAKAVSASDGFQAELTQAGFAMGTPTYMAPELVAGAAIDARVDQYSLAVMVFEFVAGQPPFTAANPAAVLWRHATVPAPRLNAIRLELPESLVDAVDRAMCKSCEERFDSCSAFVEAVLADVRKPRRPKPPKLMCPDCGKLLNTQHKWAGRTGRCPNCRVHLEVSSDLQSLWLRQDRGEPPPSRRDRQQRRPLPRQLEWIDRNGLFVTMVFTAAAGTLAVVAWGLLPLILVVVAAAMATWWFWGLTRGFRQAPHAEQAAFNEAKEADVSQR